MPLIDLVLPEFHPGQLRAFDIWRQNKYVVGRCGRRWGKTDFAKTIVADYLAKGRNVGWFAPSYKIMSEAYNQLVHLLAPLILSRSKTDGVIRTTTGGRCDFWSLENERAGRSRRYHMVVCDEVAFAKANMKDIWLQAIEPTLLDFAKLPYGGRCLMISNTNGIAEDNFFHIICKTQKDKYKFAEFHAPTSDNPYMPEERLAELESTKHPLVWQQEYLANFVDFSADPFFEEEKFLLDGEPVEYPTTCKAVFAVVDTAVKTGKEHDGTAVSFYAVMHDYFEGYALVILDWDIRQIQAALLEKWIPSVFERLEFFAKTCGAIHGSIGTYIEDASSGGILLQQCTIRQWPVSPLPEGLTAAGKDERAFNVVSPVYCGKVKFSRPAYEKTATYKETTQNHMRTQILGFRLGDKLAARRADDLLDTFTYAVAIALGDSEGVA